MVAETTLTQAIYFHGIVADIDRENCRAIYLELCREICEELK